MIVKVLNNDEVHDFFFDLVRVTEADATGIYRTIIKVFEAYNINYKQNLISFGADGANVMTGNRHSVATMLKKDCPHLVIMKCICHSFALCACMHVRKYRLRSNLSRATSITI